MAPREEDLRAALEMFPINILRRIISDRGLDVTSRRSEELIDALVSGDWTDGEFSELKSRLADVQKEQNPHSRYITDVVGIHPGLDELQDWERVERVLEMNQSDFDDNNNLIEEGFEVNEASEDSLEGTHWTESINYTLTPMGDIKKEQTLYQTGFEFDFEEDVLFIDCNLPAKATSLRGQLNQYDIETGDVGHENITNNRANNLVQEFVTELNSRLEAASTQSRLPETDSPLLEVDLINMLLDESELRDIKIGGRTDIMENEEVQRFRREHDSRIVRLEGEFELENIWYEFKVGYTEGMGYISVKKKGRADERPELVAEAFEFLYDIYDDYFVSV